MRLDFSEADHVYRVDGRAVDSVTQLIAKSGRGVDYSAVPEFVLARARERGIHCDAACDLYDAGALDWSTVHGPWKGYVEAWQRFRTEHGVTILGNQGRVYHPELDYAGSFDALVMAEDAPGEVIVVDRKCSKEIHHDPYSLQLAAYAMPGILLADEAGALCQMQQAATLRWVVQLKGDGSYVIARYADAGDFEDWEAVVRLARRAQRFRRVA